MGSRMVHTCDRCGNEVPRERSLVEFSVTVKRREMDPEESVWVTIEMCDPCLNEAQRVVRRLVEPVPITQPADDDPTEQSGEGA